MPRRRESFAERKERRAAVDDPAVVLEAATRFLEVRSRSVAEVRRRLTSAGYQGPLVDEAIARLGDLGILDDEAFARTWVESRDRARPRGERALRDELRLKGIERSLVDLVLAERREIGPEMPEGDEASSSPDQMAAERLIERHRRTLARIDDPRKRRARAYALLARNGFDPDISREVAASAARDEADATGALPDDLG